MAGSGLLVPPFLESNSSRLVAGCCEACGELPTYGKVRKRMAFPQLCPYGIALAIDQPESPAHRPHRAGEIPPIQNPLNPKTFSR